MKYPPTPSDFRSLFGATCALLAIGAMTLGAAFAATPPPPTPPNLGLSAKIIEGEPTVSSTSPSAGTGSGRGGSTTGNQNGRAGGGQSGGRTPGGSSNSTSSSSSQAKTYVEITLRNNDQKVATEGFEVDWHVYTHTSTLVGNKSEITMKEITGSETVDSLAPNEKKVINSDTVVKSVSTSSSTSSGGGQSNYGQSGGQQMTVVNSGGGSVIRGGGGGGGRTVGGSSGGSAGNTSSSSVTTLEGYYIEIKYNGKVLKKTSTDEKDKYDAYMKSHPGG